MVDVRKSAAPVLVGASILGAAFLAVRMLAPGEPTYQGKGLAYWLDRLPVTQIQSSGASLYFAAPGPLGASASADELWSMKREAEAAIVAIGTNSLPTLLGRLEARDSAFKRMEIQWLAWARKRGWLGAVEGPSTDVRRGQALSALLRLGGRAERAIPRLVLLATRTGPGQLEARYALKVIAPYELEAIDRGTRVKSAR